MRGKNDRHICIFTSNFLPNLGGLERYVYNMSKEFMRRGHQVTIVTSNTMLLPWREDMEGMTIYRLPCFNLLNGRFPVLKYNRECRRILSEVKKVAYDFIIVTPRFYLHSFLGGRYAKKHKVPSIVVEHGTGHFTISHPLLDWMGRIYEHVITGLVKTQVKYYAGVSRACNEWLTHFGIRTDTVLYNTVDLENISSLLDRQKEDFRDKCHIPKEGIIVTYTGRLVPEKGALKLLEACNDSKYRDRIYLMVAGTGELYEKMREYQSEHVHLLGNLPFEDVVSLLKQTDIFCLPTDFSEGFPTSVIEAVACQCYVITTTSGGSKELITGEEYGMILKDSTVSQIAQAIDAAIARPEERLEAARKANLRLHEKFTWEKTVDAFFRVMDEEY